MRHMRPWGHIGLLLTQGLPWSLAAVAIHPSAAVALGYLGGYMALRMAMMWIIGVHGLHQPRVEADAAHSSVGRRGIRHLAGQFRPQHHPLARRRLSHSGRPSGSDDLGRGQRLKPALSADQDYAGQHGEGASGSLRTDPLV